MAVQSSSIATMTKAIMVCAILLFIHTTPLAGEVAIPGIFCRAYPRLFLLARITAFYVTAHFRNGRTVVSPRGPVRIIARRVGFVNFCGGFRLTTGTDDGIMENTKGRCTWRSAL